MITGDVETDTNIAIGFLFIMITALLIAVVPPGVKLFCWYRNYKENKHE